MVEIAITGSSGLIGTALRRSLESDGHRPIRLVRSEPRPGRDEVMFKPSEGRIDEASLEGIDAIVNLAGAPIGTRPWTEHYKQVCVDSRVKSTTLVANAAASLAKPPRALLSGSAIGYYGTGSPDPLTEDAPRGEGFLADLAGKWEAAAQPAIDAGIRTVLLRTGLVMASEGGLLGTLKPLFKLGLGGKLGDGSQTMSWIAIDDMVAALRMLLEPADTDPVAGPVNLVAPNPVSNSTFTDTMGEVLGRPTFLSVPRFAPRLVLGSQMTNEFIMADQTVVPAVLTANDFTFRYPTLEGCLRAELAR